MNPTLRRLALTVHLTFSIGWIGTVVAYVVLVLAAMGGDDVQTLRSAWLAMELIGWYAIVPLAVASLLTGLVMALGTKWGLLRHYWVLVSFALTSVAVVVLILHMPTVTRLAEVAASGDAAGIADLRAGLPGELLHAGVGLMVLLVVQVLNMYKPRGLTRYGLRKRGEDAAPAP
jgi:hypothetical protein